MDANVLLFALVAAALYLLVIAPARNRAKRVADIKDHLVPGAEVITTSGLFGRVDQVEDEAFHLQIAPGVVVRFAKGAVGKIIMAKDGSAQAQTDEGPSGPSPDGDGPPAKSL